MRDEGQSLNRFERYIGTSAAPLAITPRQDLQVAETAAVYDHGGLATGATIDDVPTIEHPATSFVSVDPERGTARNVWLDERSRFSDRPSYRIEKPSFSVTA